MGESRRLRFSLATLLLVTTIAAMGITITLLMHEIGPLRAEVKKLREETGKLWIEDETKIHAIRIPNQDLTSNVDEYRVYLPQGKQYALKYATNKIPAEGTLPVSSDFDFPGGEYLITIQLEYLKDEKTREPIPSASLHIKMKPSSSDSKLGGAGIVVGVDEHDYKWMDYRKAGRYSLSTSHCGPDTTTDHTLVIHRARICEHVILGRDNQGKPNRWTSKHIAEPTDGYMVWIEPVK